MTVKRIIPCVCIDHKPNGSDTCDYGMPKLYVANSIKAHKQFWIAYCPKCKRGWPGHEKVSSYQALVDWNKLQQKCWDIECREFWVDDFKEKCPMWRRELYNEFIKEG